MGDSISEGSIGSWNKKVGDWIENEEVIAVIETDKVSVEIHAPMAGTLKSVAAQEGETVEVGSPLCEIDDDPSAKKAMPDSSKPDENKHLDKSEESGQPEADNSKDSSVTNDSKKSIDSKSNTSDSHVKESTNQTGSQQSTNQTSSPLSTDKTGSQHSSPKKSSETDHSTKSTTANKPTTAKRIDRKEPMSRLRQRVAERLKQAQNNAASLTTFNEVDMSALMAMRHECGKDVQETHGVKLGFVSAFLCAASRALMRSPEMNAYITENGNEVVYKNYADISVAVAAPHGLLVPVVRDCQTKTMPELEEELRELAGRARAGKIALEDMVGGTLTISNGGVFGSLFGTPILNPPQAAILGLHAIKERAVVLPSGEIVARPIMFLALTYDHRLVDGREAVLFLEDIRKQIEDPRRMLLDI